MAYFYNRFAKGVENKNSGTQMTWWKTNFNMPVPDVFDDLDDWEEDVGVLIYHGEDTNFNMSGFNQGWEAIVAVTGLHYEGNEGGGTHTIKQEWLNPSNSVMFTNQITVYLSEPWFYTVDGVTYPHWAEHQLLANQGVAPWEINGNGTYKLRATVSGNDLNFSQTFNVTLNNVPSFPWYETSGYVWVEGTKLCYVWGNGFVHKMNGDLQSGTGTAGYFWIQGIYLYWIDQYGGKRRAKWALEQFQSNFSNGAPYSVSGETAGYLYVDTQFGWTHIGYIGSNGRKYLAGDGNYPYDDPA